MKRQIIRLTEGDLHRIIRESVNRILKEENEAPAYTQEDLEAAKAKMQSLRQKGDKKAFLAAAQEYQRIKEALGKANFVDLRKMSPEEQLNFSEKENDKRGIEPHSHKWNKLLYGINTQKELHKDIDAEKGPKINSELGIV